jgi:transcriptional pleiotropic regulator of transition state genes
MIVLKKYEPACIFCGSADGIQQVHGRNVCEHCIAEMKEM